MLKIVFMGTPNFAKVSLEKVYEAGYKIEAVVTNVDKPKGRGREGICIIPDSSVRGDHVFCGELSAAEVGYYRQDQRSGVSGSGIFPDQGRKRCVLQPGYVQCGS